MSQRSWWKIGTISRRRIKDSFEAHWPSICWEFRFVKIYVYILKRELVKFLYMKANSSLENGRNCQQIRFDDGRAVWLWIENEEDHADP